MILRIAVNLLLLFKVLQLEEWCYC